MKGLHQRRPAGNVRRRLHTAIGDRDFASLPTASAEDYLRVHDGTPGAGRDRPLVAGVCALDCDWRRPVDVFAGERETWGGETVRSPGK